MSENNFTTYFLYAIGEIILVVIGILIAVSIDDWNNERQEQKQQIEYYQNILVDLRKDSVHFGDRIRNFQYRLEVFYDIYDQIRGEYDKEDYPFYDILLYNIQFTPITKENQQGVIDKLKNNAIRSLLNDYFQLQKGTINAVDEFNSSVIEKARPFFMGSEAINLTSVFQEDKYGFIPPERILQPGKTFKILESKEMNEIISSHRISAGYALAQLNSQMEINNQLIKTLEAQIKL